jgi:lipopolysaccharide assembly outer membrane protein LptD (OstA)
MVGRLEIALAGLLGLALLLGLSNQQQILQAKSREKKVRKEVELSRAQIREVNATTVVNAFTASRAVMIDKTWYLDRFHLVNPDIRSLRSVRAIRSEGAILLEGNVTLLRKDGSIYEAGKVRYDQKGKTLRSYGPFLAHRGEDFARGEDFVYEVKPQRTRARKIFAHYLLRQGGKELKGSEKKR